MPLTFNFGEENRPELFEGKAKTPVTLLSGFLGTGKTTLLKHLLENQQGVRIGVVVNDVAAVNIDSQLVRRYEKGLVEVAELQNGCVCCSSADDLFSAVQNIVMRAKDHPFEHVVVELSGVGEPAAVKKCWAIGKECSMPVTLRTEVKQVITVVDASTFGRDWLDTRQALERNEAAEAAPEARHDAKNGARLEQIGQLLAEQVEWADVVVLNKMDLASEDERETALRVVESLNGRARCVPATFGKVPPEALLPPVPAGLRVLESGAGEGYSWSQTASELRVSMPIAENVRGRDVDFSVARQSLRLGLRNRAQPRLEGKLAGELQKLDDVAWEIEEDKGGRCVVVTLEKRRRGMWPGLWQEKLCSGYSPPAVASSAERRFGIKSFAFQRRRPFSAEKLRALLSAWPVPNGQSFSLEELECDGDVFKPVLRSKGFCWLDDEPLRRHDWAHAGRTLSVSPGEWWWAALDEEQLRFKTSYPGASAEYEEVRRGKWQGALGDRRQELVFIGGEKMREEAIVERLEACLLSEAEFAAFRERCRGLRVPGEEFQVSSLLKTLGAGEEVLKELSGVSEEERRKRKEEDERRKEEEARRREEEELRKEAARKEEVRRRDWEETEFLRSLGVGQALEGAEAAPREPSYEAVD